MGIMVLPTQAYSLRISKQPAAFSVLSFEGQEDISKPYWLVIEFTCARAGLPIAEGEDEVLEHAGLGDLEVRVDVADRTGSRRNGDGERQMGRMGGPHPS